MRGIPDPNIHFKVSMVKSVIRIMGGLALIIFKDIIICGYCLILAEILGIIEEVF